MADMNFGKQIKKVRTDNKLTQEQLAQKLMVSRQAVSSWENDRNLPDLEMVVLIAKLFDISLDQLILGDEQMTNKLVKDASEVRKAKLMVISISLLLIGGICFLSSAFTESRIDSNGMLHEPYFFLIPLGYLFLFSGVITWIVHFVVKRKKR